MAVDPLLAPFVGEWRGEGTGEFPGMPSFLYEEETRFEDIGGTDVAYLQRAWDVTPGNVLHAEAGIWRVTQDSRLVATISQARRTEVSEGGVHAGTVTLASTDTGAATAVMPVTTSRRTYRLEGDALSYEFAMATGEMAEAARHLSGTLHRVTDPRPAP